jgi:Glycine zipper
MKIHC